MLFGDARYHLNMARHVRLRLSKQVPQETAVRGLCNFSVKRINKIIQMPKDQFDKHTFVELRDHWNSVLFPS